MPTPRLAQVVATATRQGSVTVGRVARVYADGRYEVKVGSQTFVAAAATDEPIAAGNRVYVAPMVSRSGGGRRGSVVLGRTG